MPLNSLISPIAHAAHVLIIGGAIIGLSTAWTLLKSGNKVTVLAEEYATLDPPACGLSSDVTPLEISKPRAMGSYHLYRHMAADPVLANRYSVKMCETVFFFDKHVKEEAEQQRKIREIDRNKALVNIQKLVVAKGATHVLGKVEQELRNEYDAKVIVNPTDLRKKILANDESVYPLRGAIEKALVVSAVPSDKRSDFAQLLTLVRKFVFIVSRTNGILYVGGFSESNATSFFLEDHPNVLKMARDAETFCCPDLDMERRDSASSLAHGLVARILLRAGNECAGEYALEGLSAELMGEAAPSVASHAQVHDLQERRALEARA
ncbi:hypothetical protein EV121DRAFT_284627 [Schizophyllum commune]